MESESQEQEETAKDRHRDSVVAGVKRETQEKKGSRQCVGGIDKGHTHFLTSHV